MPAEEVRRRYAQFCETSATESSRNEIRALIAERDAEDCYMAEYMSQHIGEHFEGAVSGVTMRGVFGAPRKQRRGLCFARRVRG